MATVPLLGVQTGLGDSSWVVLLQNGVRGRTQPSVPAVSAAFGGALEVFRASSGRRLRCLSLAAGCCKL